MQSLGALAHFDFKLSELDCDYYATSLHKWLFAPIGTGMLYVKRERIGDLWPLMAADEVLDADIRKFEEIGTHPAANYLAIGTARSRRDHRGLVESGFDEWLSLQMDRGLFLDYLDLPPDAAFKPDPAVAAGS